MSARATDARYNGGSAVDSGGSALDSGGSALDIGGSEDRRWAWGPDYSGTEVMVVGVSKEWWDYSTLLPSLEWMALFSQIMYEMKDEIHEWLNLR